MKRNRVTHVENGSSSKVNSSQPNDAKFAFIDLTCFKQLFEKFLVTCKQCGTPNQVPLKIPIVGSAIQLDLSCLNGHKTSWTSSKKIPSIKLEQ
jgi:hypothetical protein